MPRRLGLPLLLLPTALAFGAPPEPSSLPASDGLRPPPAQTSGQPPREPPRAPIATKKKSKSPFPDKLDRLMPERYSSGLCDGS